MHPTGRAGWFQELPGVTTTPITVCLATDHREPSHGSYKLIYTMPPLPPGAYFFQHQTSELMYYAPPPPGAYCFQH